MRCLARRSRVGSTLLRWDCSHASCDFCLLELTTVNEFTSTNTHRSTPSADQSDGKAVGRVSRHYSPASPRVGVSGLPQRGMTLNTNTASREKSQQRAGRTGENFLDLPLNTDLRFTKYNGTQTGIVAASQQTQHNDPAEHSPNSSH